MRKSKEIFSSKENMTTLDETINGKVFEASYLISCRVVHTIVETLIKPCTHTIDIVKCWWKYCNEKLYIHSTIILCEITPFFTKLPGGSFFADNKNQYTRSKIPHILDELFSSNEIPWDFGSKFNFTGFIRDIVLRNGIVHLRTHQNKTLEHFKCWNRPSLAVIRDWIRYNIRKPCKKEATAGFKWNCHTAYGEFILKQSFWFIEF